MGKKIWLSIHPINFCSKKITVRSSVGNSTPSCKLGWNFAFQAPAMRFGMATRILRKTLQKRAHWKTSPVKIGVPIRLCELKRGFKDYRHLSVPSELWAANLQFFCLTPLSRQYRYNRRINHCFEVSKCRFHRQRLQSVKYLICEMKRIPSWLKHYKQSKRCPSRGTNCWRLVIWKTLRALIF